MGVASDEANYRVYAGIVRQLTLPRIQTKILQELSPRYIGGVLDEAYRSAHACA